MVERLFLSLQNYNFISKGQRNYAKKTESLLLLANSRLFIEAKIASGIIIRNVFHHTGKILPTIRKQATLNIIAKNIAPVAPNALYIIVSNPVDIMTYTFTKESGIPEKQIIGSGTSLDTARLRSLLAKECAISQQNVHAYIFGEHGDSSFVPWSMATVAGVPVPEYYEKYRPAIDNIPFDPDKIIDYVRTSGGVIIANKGATFYAIATSVVRLCKLVLSAHSSVATVSTMMHGEYGLDDVCLSVSTVIGPRGVRGRIELPLSDDEVEKLHYSAKQLKDMIAQI